MSRTASTRRRTTPNSKRQTPNSKPPRFPGVDRMLAYARGVVAGELIANYYVRLACERHLHDLEHGLARGLEFRPQKAEAFFVFAEGSVFLEEDKPFQLDDWQVFCGGCLFGWYGIDGYRRFHTAYIEIAKGNGKTPFAAVICLYGLLLDNEHAPEIYSAAVAQDQAAICFKAALMMIDASPELKQRVQIQVGSISVPARFGVFRPLSAEHKSLDGKIVHIGVVDELHEHPNDLVVDKLDAGTKKRRNALIIEITNSGVGRESVCWRHHETSVAILEKRGPGNDAWFAFICGLDPCPSCRAAGKAQPDEKCPHCDDWRIEGPHWRKANPSLDTILPASYLRKQVAGARAMVSKENIVKRLNFCCWTEQANRWLSMVEWDQCAGPLDIAALATALRGQPCKLGIDASTVNDFSALAAMFCLTGKQLAALHPRLAALDPRRTYYPVLPFFFIPADNLPARIAKTGLRFDLWRDAGLLEATEGNMIDYGWIENRIDAIAKDYLLEEIAYDPWNITDLITRLGGKGYNCVPVRQGYATLSPPTKEIEKDVRSHTLLHGGHAVLRWMASNVTTTQDPAGNIKPDKEKSTEKIDGIVAGIMARDRWLRREPVEAGEPGVVFL